MQKQQLVQVMQLVRSCSREEGDRTVSVICLYVPLCSIISVGAAGLMNQPCLACCPMRWVSLAPCDRPVWLIALLLLLQLLLLLLFLLLLLLLLQD